MRSVILTLRGCMRHGVNADGLREDLTALGFPEASAEAIAGVWRSSAMQIAQHAVSTTLAVNRLVDIDYKFGVTAATDEVAQVGSTYLQLRLVLDRGGQREIVCVELSLPQFYHFLAQLERAESHMGVLVG